MSQHQLIKSFISGLKTQDRHWLDACARGSILDLDVNESFELIRKIARNNYDVEYDRKPNININSILLLTRNDKDTQRTDRMSVLEGKIQNLRKEIDNMKQEKKQDQVNWIESTRPKSNTEECYLLNSVNDLVNSYGNPAPTNWERSIEILCN